jgi:hypothetical protein
MKPLGKQEADDVEILIVAGRQPIGICQGLVQVQRLCCASDDRTYSAEEETSPGLRNDRGLHVTVVAHQVPHYLEQVRERLFPIHEIPSRDIAAADAPSPSGCMAYGGKLALQVISE